MTLQELENTPPHGLHDAEVQRSAVDYEHRKVTFALAVWVGVMDDPPERREAYKSGCLEITGLISLVMEPPDARYAFRISSKLKIDGQCVGEPVECVYAHWE
jgi:hypothetical protein